VNQETFGCARCWPASADAAWAARAATERVAELVDESHFHVTILACRDCAQRFVSVFAETVDWVDSEDPQYLSVLPVTEDEAADLARRGETLTDAHLDTLGPGRRCLHRDHPKREEPRCYWGTGMRTGPHD
jgi:hypothetical protein